MEMVIALFPEVAKWVDLSLDIALVRKSAKSIPDVKIDCKASPSPYPNVCSVKQWFLTH